MAVRRGQVFRLCFRGVATHSSHSPHFAVGNPSGRELGAAGGGGRRQRGGLRSQQIEEKPPVRIRGVVGAAGVRSGRGRRPEVAGRSTETPRGPGKRRVPPWRSEARCGRQGGIWRPVSWVRHPRDLNPPSRQATPPQQGCGWKRWRGRGPQTWSERLGSRRQRLGRRAAWQRAAAGRGGRRRPRPRPRAPTPRSRRPRRPGPRGSFSSTGPGPPQVRSQDS